MVVIISTYHALNKNLLLFRQRHQGLHHLKEALGKDPFCGRFQSFDQLTAFIILFSKSSFSTFHRGVAELKQLQGWRNSLINIEVTTTLSIPHHHHENYNLLFIPHLWMKRGWHLTFGSYYCYCLCPSREIRTLCAKLRKTAVISNSNMGLFWVK